jgi:hypothetical protein
MKREAVEYVIDSRAFARSVRLLKHARAAKKRAGAVLTWRDAEVALADRAAVCAEMYIRAKAAEMALTMERAREAEKAA